MKPGDIVTARDLWNAPHKTVVQLVDMANNIYTGYMAYHDTDCVACRVHNKLQKNVPAFHQIGYSPIVPGTVLILWDRWQNSIRFLQPVVEDLTQTRDFPIDRPNTFKVLEVPGDGTL